MITTAVTIAAGLYHSLHYSSHSSATTRLLDASEKSYQPNANESEDKDNDYVEQHQNRLAFVFREVFGCRCSRLMSHDKDASGGEGNGTENGSGDTSKQRNAIVSIIWGFLVPFCDRDFTWVFLTRLLMQVRARRTALI